jgi:hypothetical protein
MTVKKKDEWFYAASFHRPSNPGGMNRPEALS